MQKIHNGQNKNFLNKGQVSIPTVHIQVRSIKAIPPIVRKPSLCREDSLNHV